MARSTLEQLFGAIFRGAPTTRAQSAAGQWAGRTTVPSGSATAVVSTTVVNSDSIILLGQVGNAAVGSTAPGSATSVPPFEVKTISPGGYFTVGTMNGQALATPARDTILHWVVFKTG